MHFNNKGFTLVELLAAVVIMGILSSVAVVSYTRYQEKVRQEAYAAMESSTFSAAQTYIQDRGLIVTTDANDPLTIEVSTLVNAGFLPKLEDPRKKGSYCHNDSRVEVSRRAGENSVLDEYIYTVIIKCSNYTSSHEDSNGNTRDGKIFKS